MRVNDISFWSPCLVFIQVSGADATSFLHRLSTRNLQGISRGELVENCFLDQRGRLVDVVLQILVDENKWILMSSHESPNRLIDWLHKYWFSEDIDISVVGEPGEFNKNIFLSIDEEERIDRCLPVSQNEINEENNPYNLGFGHLVDSNKGCYIGQEVMSRLESQDKATKKLLALGCTEEDFEQLRQSPEITSALMKFKKNRAVALGIFKKSALTADGFLTTANGTKAWVVSSAR